jgi:hypothetical protein
MVHACEKCHTRFLNLSLKALLIIVNVVATPSEFTITKLVLIIVECPSDYYANRSQCMEPFRPSSHFTKVVLFKHPVLLHDLYRNSRAIDINTHNQYGIYHSLFSALALAPPAFVFLLLIVPVPGVLKNKLGP